MIILVNWSRAEWGFGIYTQFLGPVSEIFLSPPTSNVACRVV